MKDVLLVYWSGTGNTAKMAELIQKGMEVEGKSVEAVEVSHANTEDVSSYKTLVMGCPSMGSEELEDSEMEPFVDGIKDIIKDKNVALFGSYGWGAGEWMEDWQKRMKNAGAHMLFDEGLIVMDAPEGDAETECINYGNSIAKAI